MTDIATNTEVEKGVGTTDTLADEKGLQTLHTPESDGKGTHPTSTPDDAVVEELSDAEGTDDETETDPRLRKVRGEAKNLRGRLKQVEEEAAGLREQLASASSWKEAALREQVAAMATGPGLLHDGADLFRAGVELGSLLDDEGNLDPQAVTQATERVRRERPHWGKSAPPITGRPRAATSTIHGLRAGASPGSGYEPEQSWSGVISSRVK